MREARPLVALEQFPGRHEQRRVAPQPGLALHLGGEARERAEVVLHLRARHVLGHPLRVLASQRRARGSLMRSASSRVYQRSMARFSAISSIASR